MDNIKNGYDFLANNKFDDAINAFSNAVNANPKDIEAHFGLSQAYYFLYKETNISSYKNTAKEHANICLKLNPKHPQSYAAKSFLSLINDENLAKNTTKSYTQTTYEKSLQKEENLTINSERDFNKNLTQENTTTNTGTSIIKTFFGFGCITSFVIFAAIIFFFNKISNSHEEKIITEMTTNIELPSRVSQKSSGATISANGVLVWVIYHARKGDNYIQYTNIDGKNAPKQILLMENITDVFEYNNAIYVFGGTNNDQIEARDMTTGEILFDAHFLKQKYPELSLGIGKIKPLYGKGIEIITKNGDQFYYLFVNQKLYSVAEKKQLESNYSTKNGYLTQYLWYTQDKETVKKTYFMAKTIKNPFWMDINATKNIVATTETSSELERFPATTQTFLEGNLVYGDQEYAIIAHKSAIGENESTLYTCIEAKTGKTIWEKTSNENLLFNVKGQNKNQDRDNDADYTTKNKWEHNKKSRYNDLVLFYLNSPTPSLVVINIKTGTITLEKSDLF